MQDACQARAVIARSSCSDPESKPAGGINSCTRNARIAAPSVRTGHRRTPARTTPPRSPEPGGTYPVSRYGHGRTHTLATEIQPRSCRRSWPARFSGQARHNTPSPPIQSVSNQNDAPMVVKGFRVLPFAMAGEHAGLLFAWSGDWCFRRAAGCGQDREGPLRAGGQALIRSRGQQAGMGPGTAGESLAGQHRCGSRLVGQAAPGVFER
jgi:hypothetical protein